MSGFSPSRESNPLTVDLSGFRNPEFSRGASAVTELAWLLTRKWLFDFSVLPMNGLRARSLRAFGAKIGKGLVIKPKARVTFPWRLSAGDHVWIGEEVYILNLAEVRIGSNVCISQRAFLCTGSHDWSDPHFRLLTKPIVIEDGAWVSANVFVGPGVTIGRNAVAVAGSVVTQDLPPDMICGGNPCIPIKPRILREGTT